MSTITKARAGFTEVALIRDPDGVGLVAPITIKERPNGYRTVSFAIMKEFERGPITERTSYLNERHIRAARKLLDLVEERLRLEKEKIFTDRRLESYPQP